MSSYRSYQKVKEALQLESAESIAQRADLSPKQVLSWTSTLDRWSSVYCGRYARHTFARRLRCAINSVLDEHKGGVS